MDILADSPLIPASFFVIPMSSSHPPPRADSFTFMPFRSLFCGLWLCCAWLSFYLVCPLSEQGIWQRRGLSLGRFLSIFILGFRVLSSFSFRCSWHLVATGFVLWTVSFGTLFWSNLLCITASFVVCPCLLP